MLDIMNGTQFEGMIAGGASMKSCAWPNMKMFVEYFFHGRMDEEADSLVGRHGSVGRRSLP